MSTEDWVQELAKTIDAMDAEAFANLFADDGTFTFGNADAAKGKDAIKSVVGDFFSTINGLSHTIDSVWDTEGTIIFKGMVTYTKKNEDKITLPYANFITKDGDKIATYQVFVDIGPLFTN